MRITILGTGSRGNAIVAEADGTRILIDAGFVAKELVRRLRAAGIAPESISTLVLTHAHGDHARGARVAARKYGWHILASAGTLAERPDLRSLPSRDMAPRERVVLDGLAVTGIRTPHDCREPMAVVVEDTTTGARCGVALDLGHVPVSVERELRDLDALVIESNHDLDMLRHGPYPRALQQRIAGGRGHLSNGATAGLVRAVSHPGLRQVVLAHLSEENNTPSAAFRETQAALRHAGIASTLTVATQHAVTRIDVDHTATIQQMDLFG